MARKTPYPSSYHQYYLNSQIARSTSGDGPLVEQYGIVEKVQPFVQEHGGRSSSGLLLFLKSAHNRVEFRLTGQRFLERLLRHAEAASEHDLVGRVVDIIGPGMMYRSEDGHEYPIVTGKVVGLRLFPC